VRGLLTGLVVFLCSACSAPAVEVTEVLNYGMCKTLKKGIQQVDFADLARIRGSRLLGGETTTVTAGIDQPMLLVAVSNGSQPTPGYGFELVVAGGSATAVRLDYRWLTPAPDAVLAQVVTSPCSVVQLSTPKAPGSVSAWLDGTQLDTLVLDSP